jgi:hypothetical protein
MDSSAERQYRRLFVQQPASARCRVATFNGKTASYHSSYSPGSGTYSCTSSSLSMIGGNEVQTDSWSKG